MSKVRLNINGKEIITTNDKNILQAALENNIEVPHLCFDERMEAYGGCGMCVVEMEGNPKLVRSCATPVRDGMVINTNTSRTKAARKTALNLLISDHRGDCRPPCAVACPSHTDVQGYVGLIANGQYKEAVKLMKEQLPLPSSIGRVCPHPCETACRRNLVEEPISIAGLKYFAADLDLFDENGPYMPEIKESSGKKIAIVGAGPAGLTAAYYLLQEGHEVEIFEAMPKPGGMLRYGIPEYRLPKSIVDAEVKIIENMGAKIRYNTKLGNDISVDYLKNKYDASFLAIGAWKSSSMRCEGENLEGVIGGIDFLRQVTENEDVKIGDKVVVVGGGNTAMDVVRTSVRLGAKEVRLLYRRTKDQMPAEELEIREAEEEGVKFSFLVSPINVVDNNGKAVGVRCQKMELGEEDASGRRRPVPIEGAEETFEADTVIAAIGQSVTLDNIKGINTTKRGTIEVVNGTFQTNIENVFAGGDAVSGPKIAIDAIAQGKNAARVMMSYLNGKMVPFKEFKMVDRNYLTEEDFKDITKEARTSVKAVDEEIRKNNFQEVAIGFTEEEAKKEAARCLECGCKDYFECQLIKYAKEDNIDTEKEYGENHNREHDDGHPFVVRNSDKCIQCGLCIRTCDEVMGITALGLIDRGFEAIVAPALGMPLKDTDCISCGQCIDGCPTGALLERSNTHKEIPLDLVESESICSYCSLGCNIVYNQEGEKIYKVTPNRAKDAGILCVKGKFGFDYINSDERIIEAMIKNGAELEKSTIEKSVLNLATKLKSIKMLNGENSIGFLVSQKLTNEEYAIIEKASKALNTNMIGSMNIEKESGIEEVLGVNASTNSLEELENTDMILAVGDIYENFAPAGVRIKSLSKPLASISANGTRLDSFADQSYNVGDDLGFLKEVTKSIIEQGFVNEGAIKESTINYEKLKTSLNEVLPSENAIELAKNYGSKKKAIIIVDEYSVSKEVIKMLANIAVITGKILKPHRGIILLRKESNTQGAIDNGFTKSGEEILDQVEAGKIKALVIIGEDIIAANKEKLAKLDYLAVMDMFMTETAKASDMLLPLVSLAESTGTLTSTDRKVQNIEAVLSPKTGVSNEQILKQLVEFLGESYESEACLANSDTIQSVCTDDNKAHLYVAKKNEFQAKYVNMNTVEMICEKNVIDLLK